MRKQLAAVHEKAKRHAVNLALIRPKTATSAATTSSQQQQKNKKTRKTLVVKARDIDANTPATSLRFNQKPNASISKTPIQRGRQHQQQKYAPSTTSTDTVSHFVNVHRSEIGNFGASGLDKKTAKDYEVENLVKLGCRRPKNPKMPLWMLQRQRQKEKERATKKKEVDIVSGMLTRSKRRK